MFDQRLAAIVVAVVDTSYGKAYAICKPVQNFYLFISRLAECKPGYLCFISSFTRSEYSVRFKISSQINNGPFLLRICAYCIFQYCDII